MKNKFLILLSAFIFLPVAFSFAQTPYFDAPEVNLFNPNTGLPEGIDEQITVTVLPKVPAPNEKVSIKIESYSTDLNMAYFVWKVDGKVSLEGTGKKAFSFFAPNSGTSATISVSAKKAEGGYLERSFNFSPADVDIIYEANTYTPPFFKGKALLTSESTAKFIAMPNFVENGKVTNPNELVYKWSLNGTVDAQNSGYGKRVYEKQGSLIQRPFSVNLEVSSLKSNIKAKGSVGVDFVYPELVIYENNPVLGIVFENAVKGNFILERPEIEFQSVPFYFDTAQKDSSFVDYTWKMNGEEIEVGSKSSSIKFRNETGEEGLSIVSLNAQHFNKILQVATTGVQLNFKKINVSSENGFQF